MDRARDKERVAAKEWERDGVSAEAEDRAATTAADSVPAGIVFAPVAARKCRINRESNARRSNVRPAVTPWSVKNCWKKRGSSMSRKLFAVPTVGGRLFAHFGHCEKFAIIEVEKNKIVKETFVAPPAHEPGSFPRFLAENGVSTIISGGMGQRAQSLFAQNNIEVFMGVGSDEPANLVRDYLNNELETGENPCDH
jgi:predicted Fe-Mo cluster-binding NifX family protein